jgi:hypothetical protein
MLDTFASCGAGSFFVTKIELEWPGHKKVIWGKSYSLEALREQLPGVAFIQLDDLKTPEQLERVRPAALIIHATSPGNYQAWIAVSGVPENKEAFRVLTRHVRRAVGVNANDKSASHATRLAGTENFKVKYGPDFPEVRILEAHPGRIVSKEQLEAMGLVAAPEEESIPAGSAIRARQTRTSQHRQRVAKVWPDYVVSLARAGPNQDGTGPDRSLADFIWCMAAIYGGWPIEQTAAELPKVSEKARERVQLGDKGYPLITAQNAAAAVERNDRKRGRG